MRKLANKLVALFRGEEYLIDDRVPSGYILNIFVKRFFMILRGYIRFGRLRLKCFIGPAVRLRCKRSIKFGNGFTINEGCIIDGLSLEGIKFGQNVSIGARTIIEGSGSLKHLGKGLVTGNNVGIGPYSHIGCAGGVVIGDDTIMGNFVSVHPENHLFSDDTKPIRLQGVSHEGIKIGRNCWIGAKAMILDGADIGDGCVIAGGSVVLKGIYEKDSVYAGNPARFIRQRTGQKI